MTRRARRRIRDLNRIRRELRAEYGPGWPAEIARQVARKPDWTAVLIQYRRPDGSVGEVALCCRPSAVPDEPFDPFA